MTNKELFFFFLLNLISPVYRKNWSLPFVDKTGRSRLEGSGCFLTQNVLKRPRDL